MTIRSLIIGIICVLFICGFGYINDSILQLESLSNGHLLPIVVIGFLFFVVLIINPLLSKWRPGRQLKAAELALIVTISAAASGIPGRAFMEQFTQVLVLPHHWYKISPGWQTRHLLDYYPKDSLTDAKDYEKVVSQYHIGTSQKKISDQSTLDWLQDTLEQVPWRQWLPPLKTWLPFIFFAVTAMVAMALVVHKQWSEHEHLQYPLATFVSTLTNQEAGHAFNATFRNRLFWLGLGVVLVLRINNGLYEWFPDTVIPIKLQHSLAPFAEIFPQIRRYHYAFGLMNIDIFPLVIAFGFLLASDISLTMGLTQILSAIFCCTLMGYGYSLQNDYEIGGWLGWNRTGAYVAFTIMILFTGRYYYGNLLKRALGLGKLKGAEETDAPGPGAVTAMRIFLISAIALCLLSIQLGLPWPIAILTVLLMLISFFVVARISAETGLFFIQPGWQPFGALLALFGGYAIGPSALVISALICCVLCIDQSQSLMAYLTNGLKLADSTKINPKSLARTTCVTYLLGFVVALVVVLACIYQVGVPRFDWCYYRIPTLVCRAVDPVVLGLQANGTLMESQSLTSWQRLFSISPSPSFCWAFAIGFLGVILFAVLRLRCKRWPLHPCMFILWATYPMCMLSNAFLIGWLLKVICQKFGGAKLIQHLKPLCYGVIAADIIGALIFMIAGALYFFMTDEMPPTYRYFPR